MPVRHSVLALYGAVGDAVTALNLSGRTDAEADTLRHLAKEFTGLTGSAGEIGWLNELFRYFNDRPTVPEEIPESNREQSSDKAEEQPDGPVKPPTLEQALDEFSRIAQGLLPEETLEPSWAIRAIETAYIVDRLLWPPGVPRATTDTPLGVVLGASPLDPTVAEDGGVVGYDQGEDLAAALRTTTIETTAQFRVALRDVGAGVHLHTAITTADMDARLRKVKDEYCAVVRTSVELSHLEFAKLKKGVNPVNWPNYFGGFFCAMTPTPEDEFGWTPVRESVSGECGRYRLRTPLKFWSELHNGGLFLNYDLAYGTWAEADEMVLVDNGFIWITPLQPRGVQIRTSKELLISGMSATALAVMAKTMGWATNATDMFLRLNTYAGALVDFAPSTPGQIPPPDTSTTWPTVIPQLPADLRDEMCHDTNDLLNDGLDIANGLVADYSNRWKDGIDRNDVNCLVNHLSNDLNPYTKKVFDTVTGNFRPKPQPDPGP